MRTKWKKGVFVGTDGVAIDGYDTVAYFTERRPEQGSPSFEVSWSGSKWRFARAASRDLFLANPEKYAPQCGGLCALP